MIVRDKLQASLDKRANVNKLEADGLISDSFEVRMSLMEKVRSGEITLEDAQRRLKNIKRNGKKSGKITRNQAFNRG